MSNDGEYLEAQVEKALDLTLTEFYGDGPAVEHLSKQFKEMFKINLNNVAELDSSLGDPKELISFMDNIIKKTIKTNRQRKEQKQ